jgi:cytosine/adenosine deaminase-related metal-dependent hydrolase
VLTLGQRSGNHAQADVLIEDDRIAEVGQGLRARDAEQVDATDTIVMPGFVDAHRHAWRSLSRNLGETGADRSVAERFEPDDVYAATLIGLLGAAEAGVTTVVDWADLPLDEAAADAALQAHTDSALRTVFVLAGRPGDHPSPRAARLTAAAGPTTTIAFGVVVADPATDGAEWSAARELGLRIHAHPGEHAPRPGEVGALGSRGLLGDDVVLTHRVHLDGADLEALSSSGASVVLSPSSEMAGGLGAPVIQGLIDEGIRPGLGVDDERVAPGDMFAQMRATISLQHATVFDLKLAGKAGLPKLLNTRNVIRYATVDGARAAGLGGITGSIEPGKQADIVVLRTDRPNIFPVTDPIGAVVWGMDTSNVDWVFVGGRAVMRQGVLQADVARARGLAATAQRRVAGDPVSTAPGGEA